jgi:hypothetical protein
VTAYILVQLVAAQLVRSILFELGPRSRRQLAALLPSSKLPALAEETEKGEANVIINSDPRCVSQPPKSEYFQKRPSCQEVGNHPRGRVAYRHGELFTDY